MARLLPEERIRREVERWFLAEPLLFAAWVTHRVHPSEAIATIAVGRGRVAYNPRFIASLSRDELREVLTAEALRIVLKHPYERKLPHPERAYLASNITLQEHLHTPFFPSAHQVFGTHDHDRRHLEYYYARLASRCGSGSGAGSGSDSGSVAGSGSGSVAGSGPDSGSGSGSGSVSNPVPSRTPDGACDGERPRLAREPYEAGHKSNRPVPSRTPDGACDGERPGLAREPYEAGHKSNRPLGAYADPAATGAENAAAWGDDELFAETVNDVVREMASQLAWGNIGGRLRETLLASLRPKLNYRQVLRHFRASIVSSRVRLTRTRPSRRYGFDYLGRRYARRSKLLFAVDVSGSMSADDLAQGFSIVNQFFAHAVEAIDVIQFDTEIRGPAVELRRARRRHEVTGRGGTSFQPILDYLDEHRDYDGLLVYTDGAAPVPTPPRNRRTRVLWLFHSEDCWAQMADRLRPIGRSCFVEAR